MGQIFERICTQYLLRENARLSLPFVFGRIGRWWGNNSISENLDYTHLINVSRIGYLMKDAKIPSDKELWEQE
jgi:hypothetical protein